MELAELIRARRSVRAFESRHVEAQKLDCILEAANLAPSAGNLQAYEIYKVTGLHPRAALARAADQSFIAQAPIILVFFANTGRSARKYGSRGRELYALQDATIAATHAMLAAVDEGSSTVWIGAFDPAQGDGSRRRATRLDAGCGAAHRLRSRIACADRAAPDSASWFTTLAALASAHGPEDIKTRRPGLTGGPGLRAQRRRKNLRL